jgi:hypothetical protein
MYYDNQAVIYIASNLVFHERTNYIEVDCHFVREKTPSEEIETSLVRCNEQLTDIFTKTLNKAYYWSILNELGSINLYEPNLKESVEK